MPIDPAKIDDAYASPEERMQSYFELFLLLKERLILPQYRDYIGIDKAAIAQIVGMYLRDRARIKKENNITRLHRSKVAAYLMKWVLHFRPIYTTFDTDDYLHMPPEVMTGVLNINYHYAVQMMFHALEELAPQDFYPGARLSRVMEDLVINMRLGTYDAAMASLLLDALVIDGDSD